MPVVIVICIVVEYPAASPKLALAPINGVEFLYHLNKKETYRMSTSGPGLTIDIDWFSRFDPYNTGEIVNEEPTSPVIVKSRVYYTTNTTTKSTEPMKIFWKNTDQLYNTEDKPLSGEYLFESAQQGGWSFKEKRINTPGAH